jgi:hypothetical protein
MPSGSMESRAELVSCNDGQRKRSTENAHQDEKSQQILVAHKQCHRGYQLGVTAADYAAPEQEPSHGQDHRPRCESVSGRDVIMGENDAEQS